MAIGDGDTDLGWLTLLAAIYRQAIKDARTGHYDAQLLLAETFPDRFGDMAQWQRHRRKAET